MAKSLKKNNNFKLYFQTIKFQKKEKVLACILALITSLLKSRELANISKISKKLFFFF